MTRRAIRVWIGAAVTAAVATWASAQSAGTLEFVRPQNQATVMGSSTIELSVAPPAGSTVVSVTISADGQAIATLTAPPWRTTWQAGDGTRTRFLQAVARFGDGTERRVSVRTSPLRIDLVEQVALVNVYAVVKDAKKKYVTQLSRENFHVTENGRAEQIERFSTEWKPLRIGIVLDTSLSMQMYGDNLEAARQAAVAFVETFRAEDQAIVVTFGDEVKIAQELTGDRELVRQAILDTHAKGGTALYDAIWKTADLLDRLEGRKVIVLLSDGRDESTSGLEPGSLHTDQEALDRALRSETMIFAIGLGKKVETEWDFFGKRPLKAILSEMAEATGGRSIFSNRTAKLKSAFEEIAEDLRHQYSLAYSPDNERRDGAWRPIRLTADCAGCEVIARKGYFAPKDSTSR